MSIPERYKNASIDNFVHDDIRPVIDWINSDRRDVLFICGESGVGKTHLLCSIVKCLLKLYYDEKNSGDFGPYSSNKQKELPANYVLFPEIAIELRNSFDSDRAYNSEVDIIKKYRNPKVIGVFDDLAANKPSEYVAESLYAIINHRYQECTPSVYSSNLSISKIAEIYGDRIASRLASGIVFNMKGRDRRIN